jgi:hypothetical protein
MGTRFKDSPDMNVGQEAWIETRAALDDDSTTIASDHCRTILTEGRSDDNGSMHDCFLDRRDV